MAVASLRSPWQSGHVMRAASTSRRTRTTPRAAPISWAPPRRRPPATSSFSEPRGDARGSRAWKPRPRPQEGAAKGGDSTGIRRLRGGGGGNGGRCGGGAPARRGVGENRRRGRGVCLFYIAVLVSINRGKTGDFVWAVPGARSSATRGPGEFLARCYVVYVHVGAT
jgi:hypothetical protein